MKGKIALVAGLATGYVLGAKAGKERYNQIRAVACAVWKNPAVVTVREAVAKAAGKRAEKAKAAVISVGKDAAKAVFGRSQKGSGVSGATSGGDSA